MNLKVKKLLLTILYYPFQLAILICVSPFIICVLAAMRADTLSFDDVYMTNDNPWVNQNGPTMQNKKRHWWITRFIGLDALIDVVSGD